MGAAPVLKLSVEEYLALDRAAEIPNEYFDGEIFPIEDATLQHGFINANASRRLAERLDGTPCRVATPVRVRVSPTKFVYPDLLVTCGKPAVADAKADTVLNPKVIVEILSPTTEDYNYGRKFLLYQLLPSFEEYVLIAQDEPRVSVYRKVPDDLWILATYRGLQSVAKLASLGIELPLAELYDGVEWTSSPST